jgi:hypothetical protein
MAAREAANPLTPLGASDMLTSLLPGARQVRAPLAAGYLWLLLLWLIWGDELPDREGQDRASGAIGQLYDLEPVISDLGIAAVASVVAYLVGSLLIGIADWTAYRWHNLSGRRQTDWRLGKPGLQELTAWADEAVRDAMREQDPKGLEDLDQRIATTRKETSYSESDPQVLEPLPEQLAVEQTRRWLELETIGTLELVESQLLTLAPALHAEVDRRENEATFRLALAPPLALLTAWLTITDSPLWAVGALLVVGLVVQGRTLRKQAGDELVTAMRARNDLVPAAIHTLPDQLVTQLRDARQAAKRIEGTS